MRCFFYRILISHALDGDRPLPDKVRRHLQRCPACRRFHETSALLPEQFRAAAEGRSLQPSVLTGKLTTVLQGKDRPAVKSPFSPPAVLRFAALVLVFALILAGGFYYFGDDGRKPPSMEETRTRLESPVERNGRPLLRGPMGEEEALWLSQVTRPLEQELHRIKKDAKTVSCYVVSCFPFNLLWRGEAGGILEDG